MMQQAKVSRVLGVCLAAWALGAPALAQAEEAVEEFANSVEKDLGSLNGDWQGQSSDGTKVGMHFSAARGSLPLSGKWKIDGGAFASETDVSVVRAGGFFFLVPEASPFVPGGAGKELKEPYAMARVPGGGFRFARLTRIEAGGQVSVQAEQILIGKQRSDGSRTLKLATSDKLCADTANATAKVCGEAVSTQILLRKVGPAS
jgi:hypothetical protein